MTHDDDRSRRPSKEEAIGIGLLLASAVAFSAAGVFTRMAPVEPAAMIVWRNLFGGLGLAVLLGSRGPGLAAGLGRLPRAGWVAAMISAAAMICYLSAFAYTSVANVSIIYASAPLMAAVLARVILGERMAARTATAAGLAVAGVALTVGSGASRASLVGDGLALLMTLGLSVTAVLTRGWRLAALPTALASAALAAAASLPLAWIGRAGLQLDAREAAWLSAFGLVTITFALPASLAGTARVPAGRAMLIGSLELPLAPLWVWLAVGETPSGAAMAGGALVLAAVLWDLAPRPGRRDMAVSVPRDA